jgi:hypothetical protein
MATSTVSRLAPVTARDGVDTRNKENSATSCETKGGDNLSVEKITGVDGQTAAGVIVEAMKEKEKKEKKEKDKKDKKEKEKKDKKEKEKKDKKEKDKKEKEKVIVGEPTHHLLRVGDGDHFFSSQLYSRWGIKGKASCYSKFLQGVREGDILWFIQAQSEGKVIGVATYTRQCVRVLGPLINLTPTNEELGWIKTLGDWDTEIHYTNLYDLSKIPSPLLTKILYPNPWRVYNENTCAISLPAEYVHIVKYLRPDITKQSI